MDKAFTEREQLILLSIQENSKKYLESIQIQKVLFLINEELIKNKDKTSIFNFVPYNYGPFDKDIYKDLVNLISKGFVVDVWNGNIKRYEIANEKFNIDKDALIQEYGASFINNIHKITNFVSNLTFDQLLNWLYSKYPTMAINSIYKKGVI